MDFDRNISAALLKIRMASPFFGCLSLFAKYRPRKDIPTACTDGENIFFNEDFMKNLDKDELCGVLLHELLHCALLHTSLLRKGIRDNTLWNIAADVVVNNIIQKQGNFALPSGSIQMPQFVDLSVEQIYEKLMASKKRPDLKILDIEYTTAGGKETKKTGADNKKLRELEGKWKTALNQAAVTESIKEGGKGQGVGSILGTREYNSIMEPQLDWRSMLWRFLVRTPTDFSGFDRRFVHQGLYLEDLSGESVRVHVAIDTSGSISSQELDEFAGELKGILRSYPHIKCDLYFADYDIDGPYKLNSQSDIPEPTGGGGTSFVPFFLKVDEEHDEYEEGVCIYLTDGYGDFPEGFKLPTLWVVTTNGLDNDLFPFGSVTRLNSSSYNEAA